MQTLDWAVLIGTLIFIVFYGIWKNKNPKNINEYLKAGNQEYYRITIRGVRQFAPLQTDPGTG